MREAEYELVLDAIRDAMAPVACEDAMGPLFVRFAALPKAANDNQCAWPLLPFPDGWNAMG